jgi:hypothetical protein
MNRKYFPILALIGSSSFASPPALAQSAEERAGARAAADQGFDAFKAGDWSKAVDLFQRAESLVHSPVQLLFLARSQVKAGALVEAKESYLRVLREAPNSREQNRLKAAASELAALEPQIPMVTVVVEGLPASEPYEVTQDGQPLARALIGVARPLNPGEHSWRATNGERQNVTVTHDIEAGSRESIVLRLRYDPARASKLQPSRESGSAGSEARPPAEPSSARDVEPTPEASSGTSFVVYAGFGLAVVGAGAGVGFLLHQGNIEESILSGCPESGCEATSRNLRRRDDADRAGLFSAVGFAAAGVGLTTAITLLLLDGGGAPSESATLRPFVGLGNAGISGSF